MGKFEWIKIQTEIEKQYRLFNKELLSIEEYNDICKSSGMDDIDEQMQFLSILNVCGSCIAIEDGEFSILNPNWIADYLYLFYDQMPTKVKGIMDYKKEYLPMLNKLKEYAEYKELITDYLEERGLCTLFRDDTNRKKIFIPMFLSEEPEYEDDISITELNLKYRFTTSVIPEYEFHKFLVREFEKIRRNIYSIWQFGLYFRYNTSTIQMQLMNDGILLEIWAKNIIECRECLQWIRNAVINTARENFFEEYVLVKEDSKRTFLPYRILETLNSLKIKLYCLPEEGNAKSFVLIDVESISQKCGLIKETLEEAVKNQDMRKKILEGSKAVNVYIENMRDINNYEANGKESVIYVGTNDQDSILIDAVNDLKRKMDSTNENYSKLIELLDDIENPNPEKRSSIKRKLREWVSDFANFATIGDTLYNNRKEIVEGVRCIIELLK